MRSSGTEVAAPLLGIDLGGTKLLGVAVDPNTRAVVASCKVDTPTGGPAIVDAIISVVQQLGDEVGSTASSVGIGAAGLVDRAGILRFGPNLARVVDLDLPAELGPRLGVPIRVDNDSTCGALAELLVGAAEGVDSALVVALGTGIGGGLIMGGRMWRGAHHMAAEIGHLLVDPQGPPCGCGQRGCWEQFASGNALGRLAREAAAAGEAPSLLALADGQLDQVTGVHVTRAARDGDSAGLAVLETFARWVGVGVSGLVDIFDPELVVIGGGLCEEGRLLLDPVERHVNAMVMGSGHRPPVPVVAARAGEAAAALGAALLIQEQPPTA